MRVVIEIEGDHIGLTLIPENDIETMVVRNAPNLEVSKLNGNIVLTKVVAEVRRIESR